MPKIVKKRVKQRGSEYKRRKVAQREFDQKIATDDLLDLAARFIKKYDAGLKRSDYTEYFDLAARLKPKYRNVFDKKFLSSKRLMFNDAGELTLESGTFRTKREVLKRDDDSGEVYLGRLEKESWRRKAGKPRKEESWTRDKNGKILEGFKTRADGRFNERWELDENGKPIRTEYFTDLKRDGRFFRPIDEVISESYKSGLENKNYRRVYRMKGATKKVYERDADGNLDPIGLKKLGYSWASRKSTDRKTSNEDKERLWGLFSKSYQILLDESGNELARDVKARRRFLSKRSATFDDKTNLQKSTQHKVGKFLYKNDTDFHTIDGPADGSASDRTNLGSPSGEPGATTRKSSKTVTRTFLGLKRFSISKTVDLSSSDLKAQEIGTEEVARHKQHWADVAERIKNEKAAQEAARKTEDATRQGPGGLAEHPVPGAGTTKLLGGAHSGLDPSKPQTPPTLSSSTTAARSGSKTSPIDSGTSPPVLFQASSASSSTAPRPNVEKLLATLAKVNAAGPPATSPPADPAKKLSLLQAATQRRDLANRSDPAQQLAPGLDLRKPQLPPGLDLSKPQLPPSLDLSKPQPPPSRQQPALSSSGERSTALSDLAAAAARRDARPGENARSTR